MGRLPDDDRDAEATETVASSVCWCPGDCLGDWRLHHRPHTKPASDIAPRLASVVRHRHTRRKVIASTDANLITQPNAGGHTGAKPYADSDARPKPNADANAGSASPHPGQLLYPAFLVTRLTPGAIYRQAKPRSTNRHLGC